MPQEQQYPQQPIRQQPVKAKTAPRKHPGWSAVTAEERGAAQPVSSFAHSAARPAQISDAGSFPALSGSKPSAPKQSTASIMNRSPWQSPDRSHARDLPVGQIDEARWKTALAARDTNGGQRGMAVDVHSADAVQSLRVLHPWADTTLLQVHLISHTFITHVPRDPRLAA